MLNILGISHLGITLWIWGSTVSVLFRSSNNKKQRSKLANNYKLDREISIEQVMGPNINLKLLMPLYICMQTRILTPFVFIFPLIGR